MENTMTFISNPNTEVCGRYGRLSFEEEIMRFYETNWNGILFKKDVFFLAKNYASLESPLIKESVKRNPIAVVQKIQRYEV